MLDRYAKRSGFAVSKALECILQRAILFAGEDGVNFTSSDAVGFTTRIEPTSSTPRPPAASCPQAKRSRS